VNKKIQMLSACALRLRIIHGFFDSEKIVLRFTPFIDFSPEADARPDKFLLLVRHLIGHAVGDATQLHKPLKLPGPRPKLEKVWKREVSEYNRTVKAQRKKEAEQKLEKKQKLKEQRKLKREHKLKTAPGRMGVVNGGRQAKMIGLANGSSNGALQSGTLKRPVMLGRRASV
jgi:hypothetical protein